MLQGCRNGGPRSETRNGLNGHNGTYIGECDLGREWRGRQARNARLAGRDCGRDRQQPRGLAAAEDHGRALVGQPKQGSWFALATPITDFQRQHRRNVETGCRGGTEGGEVTAEECCIAPRCRVEPFLDQGGAATRRRWPGAAPGSALGGLPGARRATCAGVAISRLLGQARWWRGARRACSLGCPQVRRPLADGRSARRRTFARGPHPRS